MALPGKKPEKGDARLKCLIYGDFKAGKTFAAAQFPDSYFIDTEGGAKHATYVDLLTEANALYYETNSFDDIVNAVRALLNEQHDRRTLVIDSITPPYADLVETGERLKGDDWGKHLSYADARMRRLFLLTDRLDMNFICTSQAKPEYAKVPGGKSEMTGRLTVDGWKKLGYIFDLIVEIRRVGKGRCAEVRGSRLGAFPEGDTFEWSYDEFQNRLGKESLEREAAHHALVEETTLRNLRGLINESSLSPEDQEKWLKKAHASAWEDISQEQAEKAITYLETQVAKAS